MMLSSLPTKQLAITFAITLLYCISQNVTCTSNDHFGDNIALDVLTNEHSAQNSATETCLNSDDGETCSQENHEEENRDEESISRDAMYKDKQAPCRDEHKNCREWADVGECDANPGYMLLHCQKSCDVCSESVMEIQCRDLEKECVKRVKDRECDDEYMVKHCKRSCGYCNVEGFDVGVEQPNNGDEQTLLVMKRSYHYIRNEVLSNETFSSVIHKCNNTNANCAFWASIGECDANPGYMQTSCSLACRSCHRHLPIPIRCPIDPNAKKAFEAGDLNKMFERILDGSIGSDSVNAKYGVNVHSRPYRVSDDKDKEEEDLDYKIGPWVVTFDSFLTDEECDRLIDVGGRIGYERSANVGSRKADGTYGDGRIDNSRTSENAWCTEKDCHSDDKIMAVINRMASVTGIPQENQEYLQLLKYSESQYYRQHHDFIQYHLKRQVGPRLLTFFLYLNDVEKGGGTKFNDLGITIMPKKGKAVLWPSVLDKNPLLKEYRTHHEALPVEDGVKYGANAWIHQHDFKGPFKESCIE